jgi:WD40 repeat protein
MRVDFSTDEQFLATGGRGTAVVWNITEGRIVQEFAGHQNVVSAVGFSPDQKRIATVSWDSSVHAALPRGSNLST